MSRWPLVHHLTGHDLHPLVHLGFDELRLHRVVARIDARNRDSLALGERLGMRQEAYLLQNEWFKGGWGDEVELALLAEEWPAAAPVRGLVGRRWTPSRGLSGGSDGEVAPSGSAGRWH